MFEQSQSNVTVQSFKITDDRDVNIRLQDENVMNKNWS